MAAYGSALREREMGRGCEEGARREIWRGVLYVCLSTSNRISLRKQKAEVNMTGGIFVWHPTVGVQEGAFEYLFGSLSVITITIFNLFCLFVIII